VAACVLLVSTVAWIRVPLLPDLGEELSLSATTLGWVVAAFGIGRLVMDLPAGRLADRFPPLYLFAVASLVMCVGSGVLAAAQVSGVVLVASFLLGAGSATSNTTGMATMSAVATDDRRGSAMALYSGSLLVGQALGPALAGLLASIGGWRTAAGAGAVLALAVAAWATHGGRRGKADSAGDAKRRRERTPGPDLTRTQHIVLYGVAFSVFFTVGSMPQMLIPLIGADDLGLDTSTIGLALGAGGLARVVGAFGTGLVSDLLSRRWALLPCLIVQALGVAVLLQPHGVHWWLLAIIAMSLGSSGHAVGATMLGDRTPPAEVGRALGRYRFIGDVGLVAGPVLIALVYEHAGREAAILSVCGVLLVGVVTAAVLLPETHSRLRG
jgi:MFS family permease